MTRIAAAYEEYDYWQQMAWKADCEKRHSDAKHYRRMAQDAIEQLKREEDER